MFVKLTKDDCHCNVGTLCERIAKKAGFRISETTDYDPKKVLVSATVKFEVFEYLRETYLNLGEDFFEELWAKYGPRTEDHVTGWDHIANVEDGFVVNP